ncbi:G-protein coupled receptor 54 [Holothuria leucospilota]|uniref:G-protein coupled receptor 54 n=1 Tax=Holothuria leucospilota TaxID=206669 RepID=A0A9Q0YM81_HOLLE|nr:G-protein coupled receptor 54 [Holothuria leucospilota]
MAHFAVNGSLKMPTVTVGTSEPADYSTSSYSDYEGDSLEAKVVPSVLLVILIVGWVGNSVVVFVILRAGHGRVKTATNCYIVNLAITDLFFLLCCVPWTAAIFAWNDWKFGRFMCKFVFFMMHVTAQATCLTLTAMSVDRYQAIVRPLRSLQNRSTKIVTVIIIIIWTFSLVTGVPVFIYQDIVEHPYYPRQLVCHEDWPIQVMYPSYGLYCLIMMYLIPLAIISICYLRLLITLWEQVMPGLDGAHLQHRVKDMRQRRHVTWMVLAVVLAFAICWLPLYICNIWQRLFQDTYPRTNAMYIFKVTGNVLAYSNSCINPFIYSFMGENFRRYLRRACPLCFKNRGRQFVVGNSRRTGTTVMDDHPMVEFKPGSTVSESDPK